MEIYNLNLTELKKALDDKTVSSVEVVDYYINRIEKFDPKVRAFLHLAKDRAKKLAKQYDDMRAKGDAPVFAGLPVAIKDNIMTKDMPTTCASRALEGYIPPYNATAVDLLEEKGFINLGKLNMDQFAMGSSGATSYLRRTVNPWNFEKVPGGSSSGSAAAMAARFAGATLGSDTGGSIRQPAAFCGIVGYKPTYGLISRYGMAAYASSLDQMGPMTKCVEDAAFIMDAIAVADPKDSTSYKGERKSFVSALTSDIKGFKLGIPKGIVAEGLSSEVEKAFNDALEVYKKLGAEIVEVDMPHLKYCLAVYQVVANAEGASGLGRYDGIRFGYRHESQDLEELYAVTRGEALGNEVRKRVLVGTHVLLNDNYANIYTRAMKVRRLISNDYIEAFKICDLLILPTTADSAFGFNDQLSPMAMYLSDMYTISLNLHGSCGISIPAGFDSAGMPIGVQLQGGMFKDQAMLNAAYAFEKETMYNKKMPNLVG